VVLIAVVVIVDRGTSCIYFLIMIGQHMIHVLSMYYYYIFDEIIN